MCLEADTILPDSALELSIRYLDAIIEKNLVVNLTRISNPDEALRLHLMDSLLALPEISIAPAGVLLDLGTGGGFPGVPLCVASGRHGLLLDSIGKKVSAVNDALFAIGESDRIRAVAMRAETLAQSSCESFPVVTARAVSSLASLLELASPLLKVGGLLVALKGGPTTDEVAKARAVAKMVGMRQKSVRACTLPGGEERRTLIAYEKIGPGTVRLPRRVGMAQKSPLA